MNWYLKVIKEHYADFNGRARRKEYWMFFLFNMIIAYGIQILAAVTGISILAMVGTVYSLAVLVPGIAVAVRRMHDISKEWWYILIPFYNIYLLCQDSVPGPNEYGENPKGDGNDSGIDQIGTE